MEILGPAPPRPVPDPPVLSASRTRVLEELRRAGGATTAAEIAARQGRHTNTVREHLDALVHLRLATRGRRPRAGRGRPAWSYTATDEPAEPDRRIREYASLATALAGQIARTSRNPHADALAAGQAWGSELAGGLSAHGPAQARRAVVDLLDDLGFEPEANARTTIVKLRRCPLLEAARARPDVVCPVHLGLVRGVLTELGGNPDGSSLLAFSEPGACRLELSDARRPETRTRPSVAGPATTRREGASRP